MEDLELKLRKARSFSEKARIQLIHDIQNNCLEYGRFQLNSGAISDYYLDLRSLALSSEGLFRLVYSIHEALEVEAAGRVIKTDFDAIGGPCIGADPIVGAFLYNQGRVRNPVRGFLVRKEEKTYAKKGMIIGSVIPGDKVVVLEDVCSTGASLLRACQLIKEYGCEVVQAISVVDRLAGADTLFRACNIPYKSILTIKDLIENDTTTNESRELSSAEDGGSSEATTPEARVGE